MKYTARGYPVFTVGRTPSVARITTLVNKMARGKKVAIWTGKSMAAKLRTLREAEMRLVIRHVQSLLERIDAEFTAEAGYVMTVNVTRQRHITLVSWPKAPNGIQKMLLARIAARVQSLNVVWASEVAHEVMYGASTPVEEFRNCAECEAPLGWSDVCDSCGHKS